MRFFSGRETIEFNELNVILYLLQARVSQGDPGEIKIVFEGLDYSGKEFRQELSLGDFPFDQDAKIIRFTDEKQQAYAIDLGRKIRFKIAVQSDAYFDLELVINTKKKDN